MNYKKQILISVLSCVVVSALAIGGYYYYDQVTSYVSTDNAKVEGKMITIGAPAAGEVTDWSGQEHQTFSQGTVIGDIATSGGNVQIKMPQDATIVQDNTTAKTFVAPGTPMAYAYDMNKLFIVANVKETDIDNVKVGKDVDVYVDAFPKNNLVGKVESIGLNTASQFSLFPENNTTGNFTKVTEVVPVVVSLDSYNGLSIVPGMNVSVKIHR